jgi:hypothetical protein
MERRKSDDDENTENACQLLIELYCHRHQTLNLDLLRLCPIDPFGPVRLRSPASHCEGPLGLLVFPQPRHPSHEGKGILVRNVKLRLGFVSQSPDLKFDADGSIAKFNPKF